jgi:hypothetical protein
MRLADAAAARCGRAVSAPIYFYALTKHLFQPDAAAHALAHVADDADDLPRRLLKFRSDSYPDLMSAPSAPPFGQ